MERQEFRDDMEFVMDIMTEIAEYAVKNQMIPDETIKTVAVNVKQYEALREQYHELRENFIDYVCSGTHNLAPYCLNRCEECVDSRGWCKQDSEKCHGFNPAEIII